MWVVGWSLQRKESRNIHEFEGKRDEKTEKKRHGDVAFVIIIPLPENRVSCQNQTVLVLWFRFFLLSGSLFHPRFSCYWFCRLSHFLFFVRNNCHEKRETWEISIKRGLDCEFFFPLYVSYFFSPNDISLQEVEVLYRTVTFMMRDWGMRRIFLWVVNNVVCFVWYLCLSLNLVEWILPSFWWCPQFFIVCWMKWMQLKLERLIPLKSTVWTEQKTKEPKIELSHIR